VQRGAGANKETGKRIKPKRNQNLGNMVGKEPWMGSRIRQKTPERLQGMRRQVTLKRVNAIIDINAEPKPAFDVNALRTDVADYLGEEASNVYFFGSRIRGDNRNDSDLDVLVISKQKRSMKRNIGGFECDIKYMPFIPNNFRPVV
jgi:hypothetical protein